MMLPILQINRNKSRNAPDASDGFLHVRRTRGAKQPQKVLMQQWNGGRSDGNLPELVR